MHHSGAATSATSASMVRVCTPFDLVTYCGRYEALMGLPAPIHFLAAKRARGLFVNGEMAGGYALNATPPFRYLSLVPEAARASFDLPLDELVEICCVWMEQSLTLEQRLRFYGAIARDLAAMGATHILGGSVEETAMRQQLLAMPTLVYDGPAGGENHDAFRLWLYRGTLQDMRAAFEARGYDLG